jgi:hypothetical protein
MLRKYHLATVHPVKAGVSNMRMVLIGSLCLSVALQALPVPASASDQGTIGGAAIGALGGALVGGPVGAMIGAGVGGLVGATVSAPEPARASEVSSGRPNGPTVRETTCVQDAAGNRTCREIAR